MNEAVKIKSDDFWVKVIEFLQQNWALIEPMSGGGCVYFIGDTSGVFDEIAFPTEMEAINALRRNGFEHYTDDENLQSFLHCRRHRFIAIRTRMARSIRRDNTGNHEGRDRQIGIKIRS